MKAKQTLYADPSNVMRYGWVKSTVTSEGIRKSSHYYFVIHVTMPTKYSSKVTMVLY